MGIPSAYIASLVFAPLALFGCATGAEGGSGGSGPANCVPGIQQPCACPGGGEGHQTCSPTGTSFEPCICGGGETITTEPPTGDDSSTTAEPDTDPGPCGNGVEDPGECPDACPPDCGSGSESTTGIAGCETFFGLTAPEPSIWEEQGMLGFAAGTALCEALGADHVCIYGELATAEAAGELESVAAGTTMWIHRMTTVEVDGTLSNAGLGGRCVDWQYDTNHLADGEYLEVTADGIVFHLDADTFYDGQDGSHAAVGMLDCGSVTRTIPCCNAC